jgi:asparagine synthase (glutamine-hydrolysing)
MKLLLGVRKKTNGISKRNVIFSALSLFGVAVLLSQKISQTDHFINVEKWSEFGDGQILEMTGVDQSLFISCSMYDFPKRTPDEVKSINIKWQNALDYVNREQLSFLARQDLKMHRDIIHDVETKQVPGMLLECGVAKGGSSLLLSVVKHPNRCLHMFDTYQGLPPPTAADGADVHKRYKDIQDGKAGANYYGYMKDLQGFVQGHVNKGGNSAQVTLHKGLFKDTVWPIGPVAFAHLDGDWYESTYGMLERVQPVLSVGGYVLLDDVEAWSGAREAFGDFFDVDVHLWLNQSFAFKYKQDGRPQCLAQNAGNLYALELWLRVLVTKLDPTKDSGLKPCVSKRAA